MGNWRTVNIEGSVSAEDAQAAIGFVEIGKDAWDRFHPLCHMGMTLCGLGRWIPAGGGEIRAFGNLSERNYAVEDVADTLRALAAVAPSLRLAVHCGGDWESDTCIATVVVADGVVTVGPPQVQSVGEGTGERFASRLIAALLGQNEE